jgi:putative ABC transport system ATP-binding protein
VDFQAAAGSVTVIAGPSGAGKSTLLKILAAIDRPTAGRVQLAGIDIETLTARSQRDLRRRMIGFVQQRPSENLAPGLSLVRQVRDAARWRDADPASADDLLDQLGMRELGEHEPDELSGGEQQRGGIVRAMVGNPAVLIADEPTAELDLASTRAVCAMLQRRAAESGAAVIVSTHDPEVVAIGDHIIALRDGAIQSETVAGREVGVIDDTGRIQLPAEVMEWYPARRVTIAVDPDDHSIRITPP